MSNQALSRRDFLRGSLKLAVVGAGATALASGVVQADGTETFEIVKSDQEWMKLLGKDRFAILRKEDTERPGTSALLNEKRKGTFHCAGCDLPVYSSQTK